MSDIQTMTHTDEKEISLADILRFVQRQWRLLSGVTIAIAAVSTAVTPSKPPIYSRSVVLQVHTSPLLSELLPEVVEINDLGNWASQALTTLNLDIAVVSPVYDANQRQLKLALSAPEPEQIEATSSAMVLDGLAQQWQEQVQQMLAEQALLLKLQQERTARTLVELEQELEQVSSDNLPRREAMEDQRAELLIEKVAFASQFDIVDELEQSLEQTGRELLPIAIASESAIQKSQGSPFQTLVLSLIAGFLVAVLIALVVEQWPYLQAELRANEPN